MTIQHPVFRISYLICLFMVCLSVSTPLSAQTAAKKNTPSNDILSIKKPAQKQDPLLIKVMPGLNVNSVIQNARPGSTIQLERGAYYLDTLTLSNKHDITIKAVSGTVTIHSLKTKKPYLKIDYCTNIQISGLFFQYDKLQSGLTSEALINIDHSEKININYTEISGNTLTMLKVQNSRLIRIDNNLIWGICLYPLVFEKNTQVSLVSNTVKTISDYGRFDNIILDSNFPNIEKKKLFILENTWNIIPPGD